MQHLMDPTGNFNAYRNCLQAAVSSIAQDKQQVNHTVISVPPQNHMYQFMQTNGVIPVFSLLLKDIYFLNQGNKNKLRMS